jgi:hypothetical protein
MKRVNGVASLPVAHTATGSKRLESLMHPKANAFSTFHYQFIVE